MLHGFDQQFVSKYVSENASHLTLLIYRAVLLYGQNHREPETTRRGYRDGSEWSNEETESLPND